MARQEIKKKVDFNGNQMAISDDKSPKYEIERLDKSIDGLIKDQQNKVTEPVIDLFLSQRNQLARQINLPERIIKIKLVKRAIIPTPTNIALLSDSNQIDKIGRMLKRNYFPQVKFICYEIHNPNLYDLLSKIKKHWLTGIIGIFSDEVDHAKSIIRRAIDVYQDPGGMYDPQKPYIGLKDLVLPSISNMYAPWSLDRLILTIQQMMTGNYLNFEPEFSIKRHLSFILPLMKPQKKQIVLHLPDYLLSNIEFILGKWPNIDYRYGLEGNYRTQLNQLDHEAQILITTDEYARKDQALEKTVKKVQETQNRLVRYKLRVVATVGGKEPPYSHFHFDRPAMIGRSLTAAQYFCVWMNNVLEHTNDYPVLDETIFTRKKDLVITEMTSQPESARDIILTG